MSKFRFHVIKITFTHYVVWDNRKGHKRAEFIGPDAHIDAHELTQDLFEDARTYVDSD